MLYSCYGLTIRSDYSLPELREMSLVDGHVDEQLAVDVVAGRVPNELSGATSYGPWVQVRNEQVLYIITGIARILVEGGTRVIIDMEDGSRESDMRTYLLGSGLGTILHQRGLIPLHISSVLSPEGAIAFTGPPGAGKSTLAASINAEFGWPLVCDDVAVMSQKDGDVFIESGTLRCRLWKDALDRLGVPVDGLEPDLHRIDKYAMVSPDLFVTGPQKLVAIFELDPAAAGPIEINDLSGRARLLMTMRAVYRPFFVRMLQDEARVLSKLTRACNQYRCATVSGHRKIEVRELVTRALQKN